jgi:DNA-binding Lrp family transcriptional regulator
MCPNETKEQLLHRLREKHAEGLLLWELENGFEMSPKQSVLVFETAKGILLEHHQMERGKVAVVGVEMGQSAGKRMNEAKKREVIVTLDGGIEDLEYFGRHGRKELRRMQLLRMIDEGIDQGVVFSEEDLAKLLSTSTRTVKRDIRVLREDGCEVQTRGYFEGIGRAISHKRVIVEYYLRGMTFAEIETRSRHTPQAIKRYVETFARVAYVLAHRHVQPQERSYILGISPSLLKEYETLYRRALTKYPAKLKEIEDRYTGYPNPLPYKEIDRRKEGFHRALRGKKNRLGRAHARP